MSLALAAAISPIAWCLGRAYLVAVKNRMSDLQTSATGFSRYWVPEG